MGPDAAHSLIRYRPLPEEPLPEPLLPEEPLPDELLPEELSPEPLPEDLPLDDPLKRAVEPAAVDDLPLTVLLAPRHRRPWEQCHPVG